MIKVRTENKKPRRERRAEIRNRVAESGVIKSSTAGMAVAQVLDTSPSGLRVTAPCPFPVGARVEILFENSKIEGSVRYCSRAQSTQFHVGIGETTSTSGNSPDRLDTYVHLDRLTDVLR